MVRSSPTTWTVLVDREEAGTILEHRSYGPGNRPTWRYTFTGDVELHGTFRSREALLRALQLRL